MQTSYDIIADKFHHARTNFREKKYLDFFLDELVASVEVLDVGCGTGRPIAEYLVERGHQVVGVDQSQAMLDIARKTVPTIELIHADMVTLTLDRTFSAIVAWDSVFHVPRQQHQHLFQKFNRWLVDAGWLLLSAGGSDAAGFAAPMHGQTFFYSGFDPETTVSMVEEAGFDIKLWEFDDLTSRKHIAIVAQKLAA